MEVWPHGNVGFAAVVGRPNVGKSTFINQVLKFRLAAVSSRPHTTRKRWLGIHSTDDAQVIFTDTPGIHESKNKMDEKMDKGIKDSIRDTDVIILICDALREFGEEDNMAAESVKNHSDAVILVVNKIDEATPEQIEEMKRQYKSVLGDVSTYEISALKDQNVDELLSEVVERLPKGPFLYSPDEVTTAFVRDIASEIIREAVIEQMEKELPHSTVVKIDKWDENDKKIKIHATVIVERKTQKAIVIGKNGDMINLIRKNAVEKLRDGLEKFIDLRLFVSVTPNWQNNKNFLREMGITDD